MRTIEPIVVIAIVAIAFLLGLIMGFKIGIDLEKEKQDHLNSIINTLQERKIKNG